MLPHKNISKRLEDLKEELRQLNDADRGYRAKRSHTALEEATHAQRQERLLTIKQELSNMMKRSG